MKKLIGIIGIPSLNKDLKNVTIMFDSYKAAVIKNDCIPLLIAPLSNIDYCNTKLSEIVLSDDEKESYKQMVDMCDGIIIPGGNRMYSYFDFIARYAMEKDIPLLGICMGMQLLANIDNNYVGLEKNDSFIEHRQVNVKYAHKVKIIKNTLLDSIIDEEIINVNSRHLYHIIKTNNFKINALSEDGIIEGIESPNHKFVLGIQWHPEKMIDYDIASNKIFKQFINKCN